MKDIQYSENVRNALIVLADEVTRQQLESMQPDMQSMLSTLSKTHLNGVMVTCRGDYAVATSVRNVIIEVLVMDLQSDYQLLSDVLTVLRTEVSVIQASRLVLLCA